VTVLRLLPATAEQLLTDGRKLYRNLPKSPAAWSSWEWTRFLSIAMDLARRTKDA